MHDQFDRSQSLQELEQDDWGEPNYDSYLVRTCHRLRRKPLDQFSVEDLRIMIGQSISLPYLLPMALEQVDLDPLAEGNYYPGDLLAMVLKIDVAVWGSNPADRQRLLQVLARLREKLPQLDEIDRNTAQSLLHEAQRLEDL